MTPARIPAKEDCIAVDLPDKLRGDYEGVIARVFGWPDSIGYAIDRERQAMALIEFANGHAVVWLERSHYAEQPPAKRKEEAQRVLREWARL